MKRKLVSLLLVVLMIFGNGAFIFAEENCDFIDMENVVILETGVEHTNQLIGDDFVNMVKDDYDPLLGFADNGYIKLTQSGYTATIHYYNAFIVEEEGEPVEYLLDTFYYKAGTLVFKVQLESPLEVGQCTSFTLGGIETLNKKGKVVIFRPAVSHFVTYDASFVPPVKVYGTLSGFKYDFDKGILANDIFTDKSFSFLIKNEAGDIVATAVSSTQDGSLMFTEPGKEAKDELKVPDGKYTIEEVAYPGYDVALTTLVINGDEVDTSEMGKVIELNITGEAMISFAFYNKKTVELTDETAWAYSDPNLTLKSKEISNSWGWYMPAAEGTYKVLAGAGNNNLENGKEIGTVTVVKEDGYFKATLTSFTSNGLHYVTEIHFGVYASMEDLQEAGRAGGNYTNDVIADEAEFMLIHFKAMADMSKP